MSGPIIARMSDESQKLKYAPPRHYVREWRKFRELTQEKLAEMAQFSTGAISQVETGRTAYTQDMLEALAVALGCKAGDLVSVEPTSGSTSQERQLRDLLLRYGVEPDDLDQVMRVITTYVPADVRSGRKSPENQPQRANPRREQVP